MIWKNKDNKVVYIGVNTNLENLYSEKFINDKMRPLLTGYCIEKFDHFVGIADAKPYCEYKKAYLIVNDNYQIIDAGKIVSNKTKINSRGMFVVTENLILSTDKKALFDYYKNDAHKIIERWEENKKSLNKEMLEVEVKDNYTFNTMKSYQDRISKVSKIIGALKDEYRIVANTIKSL
jgi:hypothetical protein